MMYTSAERESIARLAASIGELCLPEQPELVENTAIYEACTFFQGLPLTGTGRLILGRVENNAHIRALCEQGILTIHTVSPEDDGFQIKTIGSDTIIAGANPRGVLYGVYQWEESVLAGNGLPDTFCVPHFRKRSDGLGHYHNANTFHFGNDCISEQKVEYLARLRVNQFCICCDGSPFGNHLSEFVHSDIFPFQRRPSAEAVSKIKYLSELFARYGIDYIMLLWEPCIPKHLAPLDQYPPEALGTVRRPWGGDEGTHLERTLCVNSPLVQAHYRNILAKFAKEFPHVKGFFIYNMDGNSWLCTPELCPNCKDNLVDSDPSIHNPWETQAKFLNLFIEAAHAANPQFSINFWGPVHFHGDAVRKLIQNVHGYDVITTGCMGGDHDHYVTCSDEPAYEVALTLQAAKENHVPAAVYFAFNKLESIQTGFPNPFVVADALKTFQRWGFQNILEVTGPTPCLNQINALAMRQFESAPETDAEAWLAWLAEKQFGPEAGAHMYAAWQKNRDACECWQGFMDNPLQGSQFMSRLGLMPNGEDAPINFGGGCPVILPSVLQEFEFFYYETIGKLSTAQRAEYETTTLPEYIRRFAAMEGHLAQAEQEARAAVEAAGHEPVGISYYAGAFEGIARHTMKEYAQLNLTSIAIVHSMCVQKLHMFQAVQLLAKMRDGVPETEECRAQYLQLLREDLPVQEDFHRLLVGLSAVRPSLPLTGMCENELHTYIHYAQVRIQKLKKYLAENT